MIRIFLMMLVYTSLLFANTDLNLKEELISSIEQSSLIDDMKKEHLNNIEKVKFVSNDKFIDDLKSFYIENNVSSEYHLEIIDTKKENKEYKAPIGGIFSIFKVKTNELRFYQCAIASDCKDGVFENIKLNDNEKYFLTKVYKEPFSNDKVVKVKLQNNKESQYVKGEELYDLFFDKDIDTKWDSITLYFKNYAYKINLKNKDKRQQYFRGTTLPLSYKNIDGKKVVSISIDSLYYNISKYFYNDLLRLEKELKNKTFDKLVIDLSSCGGGKFDEVLKLIAPFVTDEKQILLYVEEDKFLNKNSKVDKYKKDDLYNPYLDKWVKKAKYTYLSNKNVEIKVSNYTSGGAEIFAGVLQQKLGYKIVGIDKHTKQYQILKRFYYLSKDGKYGYILPIGKYYVDEGKKDLIDQQKIIKVSYE